MGEAQRREQFNAQVQRTLDDFVKDAVPEKCECGSVHYQLAFKLFIMSAIVSPNGKETIVHVPEYICAKCGKEHDRKPNLGG